jgi:hypothetical protein
LPLLNGLALTSVASQNSTTIDYHLTDIVSGAVLDMYLVRQNYNQLVLIKGTISGLIGTLPLTFTFPHINSCITGDSKIAFNNLGFDWSPDSSIASLNCLTNTVTFLVSATVNIDPIAFDGSTATTTGSTPATTLKNPAASATRQFAANDVILVFVTVNTGHTVSSISTTTGTTSAWASRKAPVTYAGSGATAWEIEEWYATLTAQSSIQITITFSASAVGTSTMSGINFVNTASPFDSNGGLVFSATGTTSPCTTTFNTSNTNDIVLESCAAIYTANCSPACTWTVGAGYTVASTNNIPSVTPSVLGTEYQSFATAQTGTTASNTFGGGTGNGWGELVDAVTQASTTTTTTTTSTTTLSDPGNFDWFLLTPFLLIPLVLLLKKRR